MFKKDYKRIKGYLTVEASMIVPLVIFLIGFIFYLTFYLYNRCVVSQDTYILAFRGSTCSYSCGKSPSEIKQSVVEKSGKQFGEKYVAIQTFVSTVEADKKKIIVEASGTMNADFSRWLLPQRNWRFAAKGQAERICPTACVRKVRLAKRVTDNLNENIEMR